MVKLVRFIRTDEDTIILTIPKDLKGKLIEIALSEDIPQNETAFQNQDSTQPMQNEIELQMLDKMRNQLNVWDI